MQHVLGTVATLRSFALAVVFPLASRGLSFALPAAVAPWALLATALAPTRAVVRHLAGMKMCHAGNLLHKLQAAGLAIKENDGLHSAHQE